MKIENENIKNHYLGPFGDFLRLEPCDIRAGEAVVDLPIREAYHNPFGFVHCGIIYSLVEYAMGYAVQGVLKEGDMSATIQADIQFLSPIKSGTLRCTSRIKKKGRQVLYLQSTVMAGEKLIAESLGTYFVRGSRD